MNPLDDMPLVGEAEWPQAGQPPLRIRLVASPHYFGAGDFEDPGDMAESQAGESFVIVHESPGRPGVFDHTIPGIGSIDEARAVVEQRFPGARWLSA
jgi:hypothetical protein